MMIDTHIHLDDSAFDEDRQQLLRDFKDAGIDKIVNIGANLRTSERSLALAKAHADVYAVVGVHPSDSDELDEEHLEKIKEMAQDEKVLAIGEIGLDYYWDNVDRKVQKHWFYRQLELAHTLALPIVIHSRDAAQDTYSILKEMHAEKLGGVVHCYSYSLEMAKEFEKLGLFFGIGGVLTFQNAKKLKEVVAYLSMDQIVLETDAPYLAPVPFRGKRNSSLYLPYVVEEIARIKGLDREEVMRRSTENAMKLYPKLNCAKG